jgi:hypothetical protein
LNQNRNNNRRRGRNNRGGPGGGGGNQGNRIDSRARGNAPQLLEKYRKMAHDASLNGDRVQTEYYLQYADHYFRVVADARVPRDDQRPRNPQGRDVAGEGRDPQQDYDDEDGEELGEAGGPPPSYQTRREREREEQSQALEASAAVEGERASEENEDANPFVRESRGRRPRQRGREPGSAAEPNGVEANVAQGNGEAGEEPVPAFDPGVLPPAIGRDGDEAPRPRRTRRPRRDDDGGSEALEAVG